MGWTDIANSEFDVDSPITETLMTEIVENGEYNHDHALRTGTHATGVRMAFARGVNSTEFSIGTNASGEGNDNVTITFSDATDGDPKFDSAPNMWFSFTEGTTAPAWASTAVFSAYILQGTLSATQATVRMAVIDGNASATLRG